MPRMYELMRISCNLKKKTKHSADKYLSIY